VRLVTPAEALTRGFLSNAAARHLAVASVAPEAPSGDYLAGYGDGWEAGHVAALALAVSVLSGESPSTLIDEAASQAAVETAYPFDLVMTSTDGS
jgi:hypothetical protein